MNGMFSIAYRYELKLAMYFSYKNWNDVIGNGEVKWSLFADDMMLYLKNPKTLRENYESSAVKWLPVGWETDVEQYRSRG